MPHQAEWIKAASSYYTGACIELASSAEGVAVRNSRRPGVQIENTSTEFAVFLEAVKNGEFDHFLEVEPSGAND